MLSPSAELDPSKQSLARTRQSLNTGKSGLQLPSRLPRLNVLKPGNRCHACAPCNSKLETRNSKQPFALFSCREFAHDIVRAIDFFQRFEDAAGVDRYGAREFIREDEIQYQR